MLSFSSDWLFPTYQARHLVDALLVASKSVTFAEIPSPYGHDAFLLEVDAQTALIRPFLENAVRANAGWLRDFASCRQGGGLVTAAELLRRDFALIADRIPQGARVLDLGCGDGQLLEIVREQRQASVTGVELDLDNIVACIARDIPVVQADLDHGLGDFPDDAFDYVILSQTLQVVRKPALVVREMLRVARRGIVSFPNFGHWRVRAYLAFCGRMPVSRSIPYSWYETPNIHHTTIEDFRGFVRESGGVLAEEIPLRSADASGRVVRVWPNLFADTEIALIERAP